MKQFLVILLALSSSVLFGCTYEEVDLTKPTLTGFIVEQNGDFDTLDPIFRVTFNNPSDVEITMVNITASGGWDKTTDVGMYYYAYGERTNDDVTVRIDNTSQFPFTSFVKEATTFTLNSFTWTDGDEEFIVTVDDDFTSTLSLEN